MNYIYDILLNFNKELYDFYEWNKNDNIIHLKKIPMFKIDSRKLKDIRENNVIFSDDFLEKIKNKTEEYSNRKIKILENAFLLTDGLEVIAINVLKENLYSKLLIDEEIEVLEISNRMKESIIEFNIKNKKEKEIFKTRKELNDEKFVIKELNNIIKNDDIDQLKYIYYECFNKKCDIKEIVINELLDNVSKIDILKKINNYLKLKNV